MTQLITLGICDLQTFSELKLYIHRIQYSYIQHQIFIRRSNQYKHPLRTKKKLKCTKCKINLERSRSMTESRHMTHAKRNTIQQRNRNRTAIFHTRASQSKTRNRKLRALAITHTHRFVQCQFSTRFIIEPTMILLRLLTPLGRVNAPVVRSPAAIHNSGSCASALLPCNGVLLSV